jgi:regulator of protease activity HflC (stomatin/prohibitin superfamily)
MKIPLIEKKAGTMSLRVFQLDELVETKTSDDVFVKIKLSVQYHVLETKVYEAFYKLRDATKQISSYVYDTVRAEVPKLKLDEVFSKKDDIADAVKRHLADVMAEYGYGITRALVTEVDPDQKVKDSMNEINAAARLRQAAQEKAEAERIMTVTKAKAEAEARKLNGEGIANQRAAIINGLKESCEQMARATRMDVQDVMSFVLSTQYLDTLRDMAHNSGAKTIFVNTSPAGAADIRRQIAEGVLAAGESAVPANGSNPAPKTA